MSFVQATARLTDDGLSTMLMAAVTAASAMSQPQCIVIVDPSGVTLASFRMAGSRYLLGDIGIGSGSGEQDEMVARAALAAVGADAVS